MQVSPDYVTWSHSLWVQGSELNSWSSTSLTLVDTRHLKWCRHRAGAQMSFRGVSLVWQRMPSVQKILATATIEKASLIIASEKGNGESGDKWNFQWPDVMICHCWICDFPTGFALFQEEPRGFPISCQASSGTMPPPPPLVLECARMDQGQSWGVNFG